MKPATRVCLRCGTEAGEDRFCKTCGLDLHEQKELPTRAEWEARPKGKNDGGFGSASGLNLPSVRERISTLSSVQKLVGAGAVLAAVAVLLALTLGSDGSGGNPGRGAIKDEVVDVGPPPEERCIDLWDTPSQMVKSLLPSLVQLGDAYVSVYFAPAYPDKCVVDVFVPNYGSAYEFL